MFVEQLESRRLLSVTIPTSAPAPYKEAIHQPALTAPLEATKKMNATLQGIINAIAQDFKNRARALLLVRTSDGFKLSEAGLFLLDSISQSPLSSGAKAATSTSASYTLTIATPPDADLGNNAPFEPSFISPFGPTFTFTLNAKNPLKLFNIKQKMVGRTLNFTGTMNRNLQQFTGKLTIVGKNYHSSQTYTATPE